MSDRLLLWYRFRWLIVLLAIVLAAASGVLARRVERAVTTPQQVTGVDVEVGVREGETLSVRDGSAKLGTCLGDFPGASNPARLTCLSELDPAAPLLVASSVEGSRLLALDSWVDGDGTELLDVAGVDKAVLAQAFAGTVVDLDNDTFDEIVLLVPSPASEFQARLLVLSRDAEGRLVDTATARGLPEVGRYEGVLSTDWNSDGFVDLVLFDNRAGGTPIQLLANGGRVNPGMLAYSGAGRPQMDQVVAGLPANPAGGSSTRQRTIGAAELRRTVAAAARDLDGDGSPDLVVVTRGGVAGVLWGTKDGNFVKAPLVLEMPLGVEDLVVHDMNHDGVLDLVVAYDSTRAATLAAAGDRQAGDDAGVAVYLGSRRWDFARSDELDVTGAAGVRALTIADLDNDGWEELVVGVESTDGTADAIVDGGVLIYRARVGVGAILDGFTLDERLFDQPQPAVSRIAAIDLDGDGDLDLAFAGRGAVSLRWWRNDGQAAPYLRVVVRGAARLDAPGSSYSGIGAVVEIVSASRTARGAIGATDGRSSSGDYLLHTGLGVGVAVVDVKVTFPVSGRSVTLTGVEVDQTIVVREPSS